MGARLGRVPERKGRAGTCVPARVAVAVAVAGVGGRVRVGLLKPRERERLRKKSEEMESLGRQDGGSRARNKDKTGAEEGSSRTRGLLQLGLDGLMELRFPDGINGFVR